MDSTMCSETGFAKLNLTVSLRHGVEHYRLFVAYSLTLDQGRRTIHIPLCLSKGQ